MALVAELFAPRVTEEARRLVRSGDVAVTGIPICRVRHLDAVTPDAEGLVDRLMALDAHL
jgi:hypothetical protein